MKTILWSAGSVIYNRLPRYMLCGLNKEMTQMPALSSLHLYVNFEEKTRTIYLSEKMFPQILMRRKVMIKMAV